MRKSKRIRRLFLALCLLVALGASMQLRAVDAKAAADYKALDFYSAKTAKSGKYYFKWSDGAGQLMISTKANSGFVLTPIETRQIFSNGTQAYYFQNNTLYKYLFASRKNTKLRKFSPAGDRYLNISTVYGSRIFLTKSSFNHWKHWTYSYNVQTKEYKLLLSSCAILDRHAKYVIGQNQYRTDTSPYPLTLYKITSTGLTKVKKLGNHIFGAKFIDGKLYYTSYPAYTDSSMQKAVLYRCNPDGSGIKRIKTFQTSEKYTQVIVTPVSASYCKVMIGDKFYRYTYATKKLTRIR